MLCMVALKWSHPSQQAIPCFAGLPNGFKIGLIEFPATEKTSLFGDPKEEVVVELDSSIANSLGLSAGDISNMIAGFDAKLPPDAFKALQPIWR